MIPRFETVSPTKGYAPSHVPPDVRFSPGLTLARKLGWFSIALGIAEVLIPEKVSTLTGVRNERLLAACGVREILSGIGILSSSNPSGWMWTRVAGDAVDLAILGSAIRNGTSQDSQTATVAAAAVAGVTTLDLLAAAGLTATDMNE